MWKKNMDLFFLEDQMKRAFRYQREDVCHGILTIQNLIDKYPALNLTVWYKCSRCAVKTERCQQSYFL